MAPAGAVGSGKSSGPAAGFVAMRFRFLAVWLPLLALLGAAAGPGLAHSPPKQGFSTEELEPVLAALQARGFSRASLSKIFYDKRLSKIDRVIGLNAFDQESQRIYEPFLSRYALRKAERFRRRHFSRLWTTERRFGVPMNIVIAILLVETQFGTARLPFRVMSVFTTLAVEASPAAVARHFERLRAIHPELEREFLQTRLELKAEWALEQLAAMLTIGVDNGMDVLELRGSYAGAFGVPQFLPTSYRRWGADGNGDRRVNLDDMPDAMASIANFLRSHGWRGDESLAKKKRAVWQYNRSPPYVEAIFAISRKLSLPSKKRRGRF